MIRAGSAFKSAYWLMIALGVSACAGSPQPAPVETREPSVSNTARPQASPSTAERAAAVALQQVGVPYRYGGMSPSGFDCSGLVHYSYGRAGATVPRTTRQLWSATRPVDSGRLREGDLLFFRFDGKIAHVGLYLGRGRFVHAPSSGKRVSVESLSADVYRNAFVRGGRL